MNALTTNITQPLISKQSQNKIQNAILTILSEGAIAESLAGENHLEIRQTDIY